MVSVETFAVNVHAIGELQRVPLLGEQPFEAGDLEVLLRGCKIHPARAGGCPSVVVRERVEVVVFLAVGSLQVEILAQHIIVVVIGVEQQAPGAWVQVGRVPTAQLGLFQVGGAVVIEVGKPDAGAAMVAGIVVLGQQVKALLLIELHAQAT